MSEQSWQKIKDLPFTIETYALSGLQHDVSSGFTRKTTVITYHGANTNGQGEDVTYEAQDHDIAQQQGAVLDLAGSWTLETFSNHLQTQDLFPTEPKSEVSHNYRRWAYESAALDLALAQNATTLHEILNHKIQPVSFVISIRLGEPATVEPVARLHELYPEIHFKLDPTASWDQALITALVEMGIGCEVIDFKGHYHGTSVDQAPDVELYTRVIEGLPHALIEDPFINADTEAIITQNRDRVSWDAPIHSVEEIKALPFPPKHLNMKPSRFGQLQELFAAYDYCNEQDIAMYGGGQFELGIGRKHIQYLAAIFHPTAANDTSPVGFHQANPVAGLPVSPLQFPNQISGLNW